MRWVLLSNSTKYLDYSGKDHEEGCIDIHLIVSFPPTRSFQLPRSEGIVLLHFPLGEESKVFRRLFGPKPDVFYYGLQYGRELFLLGLVKRLSASICLFFLEQIQLVFLGFFHLFLAHPDIRLPPCQR